MERPNTLLFGRELIHDPRLSALVRIMEGSFRVGYFNVLAKDGQEPFDIPGCIPIERVTRTLVYPTGSSQITREAMLEHPLPLMGVVHVQSHPDFLSSVAARNSMAQPLRFHKRFPYGMEARTMGDLMDAINQAGQSNILTDWRLKPGEVRRRGHGKMRLAEQEGTGRIVMPPRQMPDTPMPGPSEERQQLGGGWASYRFRSGAAEQQGSDDSPGR
ncbi:MAG: hypothetical protein PHX93_02285 [Candidatus Peribacteraceae bacterium]|jgi:hypothetical protein|nr:hypothetical protein [Candidatus Peribacteraceae bacterium]